MSFLKKSEKEIFKSLLVNGISHNFSKNEWDNMLIPIQNSIYSFSKEKELNAHIIVSKRGNNFSFECYGTNFIEIEYSPELLMWKSNLSNTPKFKLFAEEILLVFWSVLSLIISSKKEIKYG